MSGSVRPAIWVARRSKCPSKPMTAGEIMRQCRSPQICSAAWVALWRLSPPHQLIRRSSAWTTSVSAVVQIADSMIFVKRVAAELGYSDPNFFSRMFKRYIGSSPSSYRLRRGGMDPERPQPNAT